MSFSDAVFSRFSIYSRCLYLLRGAAFLLASCPLLSIAAEGGRESGEIHRGNVFYSSIRKEAPVKEGVDVKVLLSKERPAGFYQLVGANDQKLCSELIANMNEEGKAYGNIFEWLSDTSSRLVFHPLEESMVLPKWSGGGKALEHASIDLDGDGVDEHIYRRTGVFQEHGFQSVAIFDRLLHESSDELSAYGSDCVKWRGRLGKCESAAGLVQYIMDRPINSRLPSEWSSTKQDPIALATADKKSKRAIYGQQEGRLIRNVGLGSSAYWAVYKLSSNVVFVSVPVRVFAPPELLVFSMLKGEPPRLQCVVMPVAWGK